MNHFERWESYVPVDLTEPKMFFLAIVVVYFFVVFRYFLIVTPFYFLFYIKNFAKHRQVYGAMPGATQAKTEIKWSLVTSAVFAVSGVLIGWLWQQGYTKIYLKFDEYPTWYMPISLIAMSLLHEVYFYFSHRLMHHPVLYRKIKPLDNSCHWTYLTNWFESISLIGFWTALDQENVIISFFGLLARKMYAQPVWKAGIKSVEISWRFNRNRAAWKNTYDKNLWF